MQLQDLLDAALASEQSGDQRVTALADSIRETAEAEDVDLAAIVEEAVDQFNTLHNEGNYDPEQAGQLEALADVTDAARSVLSEQEQAREELDRRVADLANRVNTTDEPADDGDPTGEPGTDDPPADQPGDDPEADTEPEGGSGADAPAGDRVPATVATARTPARRRVASRQINQHRNQPVPTTGTPRLRYTITASAEIPNVPYGKQLTREELADAALARFATFPVGQRTESPVKALVARIGRERPPEFQLRGDNTDVETIDRVADEKRLPGGSLVAASQRALTAAVNAPSITNDVWCSPSETDYTLCPSLATAEGMLDLPSTTISRGGLRYPVWEQYPHQPALDDPNGTKTPAGPWRGQVVQYPDPPADPGTGLDNPYYFRRKPDDPLGDPTIPGLGNLKKCIQGPCVTWKEVRESIAYLCVTSDILRDSTWPELTQRFIDDVLLHHEHYLNETYLQYIALHSDLLPAYSADPEKAGVAPASANNQYAMGSSSQAVADRVALLVTWFRSSYKMAAGATLELVAPEWFREYLKRDIERKKNRPFGTATDAEVASLFAAYSSRVQWVRDWQDIPNGAPIMDGTTPIRVMPPNSWPNTVKIMAYPAGSWVLSQRNILSLGVQYDWQMLHENAYAQMFTEDAWLLLNRCNRSFVIELTDLCANGAVGTEQQPITLRCEGTPAPVQLDAGSTASGPEASGSDSGDPGSASGGSSSSSSSRSKK